MDDVCRRIQTTFIGAIAALEESPFGQLWGHEVKPEERNEEQRWWYQTWQEVRTKILNLGNNQLRAVKNGR